MLTVEEARRLILEQARPLSPAELPLDGALGLTLAEPVLADRDSPAADKSIVDGYAVRLADLEAETIRLRIVEEVVAGAVPTLPVLPGTATRIMTGAPIPEGAEAVVMVEQTRLLADEAAARGGLGIVEIVKGRPASPRTNILRRGAAFRQGERLLEAGTVVGPAVVGLLAEVGRARVRVVPSPRVAVLSTGNELTPVDATPGPGQLRNSNGPMLRAMVRQAQAIAVDLGIARDREDDLSRAVEQGLAADVLVLSGGVSAGVLDLAPSVLARLGVRQVFHKVRVKPGKPVWFGVYEREDHRCLAFGLPGNPVSSFVCFQLFVAPALARLRGWQSGESPVLHVELAAEFRHRGDRPTYHPARVEWATQPPRAEPVRWQGSADLRGLAAANALLYFPAGDRDYSPGELLHALPL